MRLVGIKSLKPGDILAIPISTSSGKVVLNAGIELTDSYINKINNLRINKVYIQDERFSDVDYVQSLDMVTMNKAIQVVRDAHANIHKGKALDEYIIKEIANSIVEYVREAKDKGVSILSLNSVDDYIIEHSINVAILAAFMGNRMTFNYNQLCDLVTGALIHDMGRENSKDEMPAHVQRGFDVMRKCRGLSLHSSIVCYEHHENFDGSGYPRKIKGTAISEFTRVIRVADMYDDFLHGYNNDDTPLMPHQAFEYILAASGSILDPAIVEIFRDTIVFYPNGCTVTLSNGLKGLVVKQNIGVPQRPVVRVYNDTTVLGEIDLLKTLTISIKDVQIL
ncbi:MAG: HD domain-containing protein [Clostridia bacterium]|nr:HD domain-containing protein [Clostridia bacterium]